MNENPLTEAPHQDSSFNPPKTKGNTASLNNWRADKTGKIDINYWIICGGAVVAGLLLIYIAYLWLSY